MRSSFLIVTSLPPARLRLIRSCLDWLSVLLDQYHGNRAAESVATAALTPASRVKRLLVWKQVAPEEIPVAEGTLATLNDSLRG